MRSERSIGAALLAVVVCLVAGTTTPAHAQALASGDDTASAKDSWFTRAGGRLMIDFRNLASIDALVTAGAAGAATALVARSDGPLTRAAVRASTLEATLDGGARLGGALQTVGAVATFAAGAVAKKPRTMRLGAQLVEAQIVSGTITQALKFGVDRQRPDGRQYSFPSGHTSATFANATVLQREFGWKAGMVGYLAASYVGASRLSENRHYASDVLIGAAIGIISGRAVTRDRSSRRAQLTAFGGRREFGVRISWQPGRDASTGGQRLCQLTSRACSPG